MAGRHMPHNPPHIALIISPFASERGEPDEDHLGREQDGEPEAMSPEALDQAIKHCQLELKCLKALRAGDTETARKHAEAMARMESDEGESDDG